MWLAEILFLLTNVKLICLWGDIRADFMRLNVPYFDSILTLL